MNENQRAAFVQAQAACAMIDALGMQAENQYRERRGESPAYVEADFARLKDQYCINHNAVFALFRL